MNHMDLLTGYVDISRFNGVTSPDYRVFQIKRRDFSKGYFLYFFQNAYKQRIFYAYGQGASELGRWRMPTDNFNDFLVPVPPPEEQAAIANFLDRETAKIDTLINEQKRLIELLKEKRQAVISHAVNKGLDPNVKLKPSGVEWLGDVPEHWEVQRIKTLSSTISKGTTPSTIGAEFTEEGIFFIKAENISNDKVDNLPAFFISDETHGALKRSQLINGDVLVVIAGATTGKSAVYKSTSPANTNQAVAFIRPCEDGWSEFIQLWLSTDLVQREITLQSVQSAQPNLSMENLGNLSLPCPPAHDRQKILEFLEQDIGKFNLLEQQIKLSVELLQERRSVLISAAVTGKIDVRGLVSDQQAAAE